MQSQQTIAAETPANSSTLLGCFGEYEFYPLTVCSEDEMADLFAKVCQRTNPLLQGRPHDDLVLLGRAMYRKCLPAGISAVAKHKGELVALNCVWDAAYGGAWKDSGLVMPASLEPHAEVAKACFEQLDPNDDSRVLFSAFCGVNHPHTGKLFGVMALTHLYVSEALGFDKSFQYTVLAKSLVARTKGNSHIAENEFQRHIKPQPFAEIAIGAAKETVRAELNELEGEARGSITHLKWMTSSGYIPVIALSCRATQDELTTASRPCADKQLEILKEGSTKAPVSRL